MKKAGITRQTKSVSYILTYKKVKNINLRVKSDLSICVSSNRYIAPHFIDDFVESKASWIEEAKKRISEIQPGSIEIDNVECMQLFEGISNKFFPLFSGILENKPVLKIRFMKSRWGVCHITKNYITLNKALFNKPLAAIEYVILHEYVHFLHPNHQKGFYDMLQKLMPDYRDRKKLLR